MLCDTISFFRAQARIPVLKNCCCSFSESNSRALDLHRIQLSLLNSPSPKLCSSLPKSSWSFPICLCTVSKRMTSLNSWYRLYPRGFFESLSNRELSPTGGSCRQSPQNTQTCILTSLKMFLVLDFSGGLFYAKNDVLHHKCETVMVDKGPAETHQMLEVFMK